MIEKGAFGATNCFTGDNEEFPWLLRIRILQLLLILVDFVKHLATSAYYIQYDAPDRLQQGS